MFNLLKDFVETVKALTEKPLSTDEMIKRCEKQQNEFIKRLEDERYGISNKSSFNQYGKLEQAVKHRQERDS
jgi:hypothetical protein